MNKLPSFFERLMLPTPLKAMSIPRKWIAIPCAVLALAACQKSDELSNTLNLDNTMAQEEADSAQRLVKQYFGDSLAAQQLSRGPSGTVRIDAVNTRTNQSQTLYMLPDQRHLIEGSLHSPYRSTYQPKATPVAAAPSARHHGKPQLSEASSRALEKAQADAQALISQSHYSSPANNEEAQKSLEELRAAIAQSQPGPHGVASLPRNNNIADKEGLFKKIEAGDWIQSGEHDKVLYVFYDFKCPACKKAHEYLDVYLANDEVEIRYLPVGALGPESLLLATLSLIPDTNKDKLSKMKQLEKQPNLEQLLENQPSDAELEKGQLAALKNFQLLAATNRVATPTFAYRTAAGAQIGVLTSKEQLDEVIRNIVKG